MCDLRLDLYTFSVEGFQIKDEKKCDLATIAKYMKEKDPSKLSLKTFPTDTLKFNKSLYDPHLIK